MLLLKIGDDMKKGGIFLFAAILLTIISLVCLTLSISYSFIVGINARKNVIRISSGANSMSDTSEQITDLTFTKMTDSAGLSQSSYHSFTISKNNSYSIYYEVSIGYNSYQYGVVPIEYAKIALYTVDSNNNLSSAPIVGPVKISELPISLENELTSRYRLTFGTFESGNKSQKYALKVWLDNNMTGTFSKGLNLKLYYSQRDILSTGLHNISGTVVNSSGSAISGATVSFQNGMKTTTTASNGSYTLTGIPYGDWNISVTTGGTTYTQVLSLKSGSAYSVNCQDDVAVSGGYVFAGAYQYASTPSTIVGYSQNSLTLTVNYAYDYYIPRSCKIITPDSVNTISVTPLNMKLDSKGILFYKN